MERGKNSYNKQAFLYGILIALLAAMTTFRLPYQDKTISEFIIPTIKFQNITIYLSGIITVGLVVWSSYYFVKSGRYKNRFVVAFVLLIVVVPLIGSGLRFLKLPVYMMSNGARSIEMEDMNLNIHGEDGEVIINFSAEAKSYTNDDADVNLSIALPESAKGFIEENKIHAYEFQGLSKGRTYDIEYSDTLVLKEGYSIDEFLEMEYDRKEYKVILEDKERSIVMKVDSDLF